MLIASPLSRSFLPSYQFSIRLSFPSLPPTIPLYQSSTSSAAEMYKPPLPWPFYTYACVRASPRFLLRYRSLNGRLISRYQPPRFLFVRVPRKNRTQGCAHRSYYLMILFALKNAVIRKGVSWEVYIWIISNILNRRRDVSVRDIMHQSSVSNRLTMTFLNKNRVKYRERARQSLRVAIAFEACLFKGRAWKLGGLKAWGNRVITNKREAGIARARNGRAVEALLKACN